MPFELVMMPQSIDDFLLYFETQNHASHIRFTDFGQIMMALPIAPETQPSLRVPQNRNKLSAFVNFMIKFVGDANLTIF